MGIFEQLGSVSLIIGGALVVLAIIALVWMYLWFKKTKEYNMILKSIDDKVDACNTEELKEELKNLSQQEAKERRREIELALKNSENAKENSDEKEQAKVKAPKVKHNFKRAMAAIETLEKDEIEQAKALDDKIQAAKAEAEKVQTEILKAAKETQPSKETVKRAEPVRKSEPVEAVMEPARKPEPAIKPAEPMIEPVINEPLPEVDVKTVEIPKTQEISVNWDEPIEEKPTYEATLADDDEDDEECAVDVFDEIRKMLVETEKNTTNEFSVKRETPEVGNVAKSGKEYTREELEDLIKF